MDQNSQFDYELKRKRELARGYVKKYREKKRQEAQQRKLPLQKEQIPQHKLERQRELSRERSRRYRDKKRLCTMNTFKHSIHDSQIPWPLRCKRPLAAENQRTTIQNSWSPATSTNMNIPLVVNDYSGNVNDDDLFQTRPNNLILIKEEPNIDERFITEDEDESAINIEIKKEIDSENDEVGDIEMKQGTNAGFSSVITNEEDIANTRIKKEVDSDGSTEMEFYDESNQIEIKEEVDLGITTGDGDKDGEGGVLQQYSTSNEGDAVSSSYRRGELISQDKSAEKRYKCNYCSFACKKKSNLVTHIRTHTGEKPFSCDYCPFACIQKADLAKHVRTHTGEKPFTCEYCSYATAFKSTLLIHTRAHTGEKPYSCNYCSFVSSAKSYLLSHLRTHTGEKPFSCDLCPFTCARKTGLLIHLRTHTDVKPYSCNFCSFTTAWKSSLNKHVRIHTGEKPFSCCLCPYTASTKWCLVVHLRRHSGEKPFNCNLCTYASYSKSHLEIHLRAHTDDKQFTCSYCSYTCNRKSSLTTHIKYHTGE